MRGTPALRPDFHQHAPSSAKRPILRRPRPVGARSLLCWRGSAAIPGDEVAAQRKPHDGAVVRDERAERGAIFDGVVVEL